MQWSLLADICHLAEKAEPDKIKRELKMSKNAFKRALGHLLKEGKIEIGENRIEYRKEK